MKILILTDDFLTQSSGGAGVAILNLIRGLQKAGHQVFVITTVREKKDEGVMEHQGFKIFRIAADYNGRWRPYLSVFNPQTVKNVEKIIKEIRPDVVHAHNLHYYLSYHCLKASKKLAKAVFLTTHDVMSFNYKKLDTKKYLEHFDCRTNFCDHLRQAKRRYNPLRNLLIKKYLGYADKIFAVSFALKEALNQNGIQNVEVIHNGIDVDGWQVSPELVEGFKNKYGLQNKKIIFFGGRINNWKGKKQMEQAISKIEKEVPDAVLLVAGDEGIGWLKGDDLKAAYGACDVVAVPSICFDSFPGSNLEAMASRKPVVGTCFGGTPEIVQDGITGFIVNPFNVDLLADKIIDLLKNPQKARQFGEAGYERVKKHFSLDSQIKKTINFYENFIA